MEEKISINDVTIKTQPTRVTVEIKVGGFKKSFPNTKGHISSMY